MLKQKVKEDLDKLIVIGKKQNGLLNSITFYNFIVTLPKEMQTEEILTEAETYLEKEGILVVADDVEIEETDAVENLPEIRPFDPSKIDIDMKTMELSSLIKRIRYDEVNLDTGFQRKAGLWSRQQKSQLIESLLLKIPIPAFYFDGGINDSWLIIDGLQRITTLKEFVVDETLKLTGLEFFKDLEGLTFSELPRAFTRRIEESNIIAFIVKGGTPPNVKFNIFKRINTGGLELTPQEIRNALYQGRATGLCKRFADFMEFKDATSHSIKGDRMTDQEFVLRFMAVCYYGLDKYEGVMDNYLNATMEYLNSNQSPGDEELETSFKKVMNAAQRIFGKYAFRKLAEDGMRRPINKAIYEAWCVNLFLLSDEKLRLLEIKKNLVYREFLELCQSEYFLKMIKASDRKMFLMRSAAIDQMLEGILRDK